ncbi:folliculin-interacting protein middle domain-containing protein [Ditylenchus destructor]|uniref:Folliculin-interacting protein middle domain-containing protein n=1 Tax=Ditylenchus destructor TaxID=166010 RepID=A0AAD4NIS1_9BILA|nr:folliculin-interacting protein middle domain-containing protein [Ditylenchus destructor]
MAIFKRLLSSSNGPNNSRKPSSTGSTNTAFPDPSESCSPGNHQWPGVDLSSLCWNPYKTLRKDALRLVVFSGQGGRLLYDTATVIATADRLIPGAHKSSCGRFQFLPHNPDTVQISKMVFGSMGSSVRTDSLKIHTLLDSDSLMISRLFTAPKANKFSSPIREHKCVRETRTNPGRHDDFTAPSAAAIMEELKAFSPNRLSRARRRQLSLKGLCDDAVLLGRNGNRSRMSSCSSISEANHSTVQVVNQTAIDDITKQYGIALLFPGQEKGFVFQHILQIEQEIHKLIAQIHRAVNAKTQFFSLAYQGWAEFCTATCVLHNSLRLKAPVWLSLTDPTTQESTAEEFCRTLAKLADQLNTKDTKFFLSTLLSSVLMNHLAWVASVAPPENCTVTVPYDRSLLLGTCVIDARRSPYNAMLAQFLELYGSVGVPGSGHCFAKTVVLGDSPRLVSEILYILSYFIRCSTVDKSKRKEALSPDSMSPIKSFADESCCLSNAGSLSGDLKKCDSLDMDPKGTSPPTSDPAEPMEITVAVSSACSDHSANGQPPHKTRAITINPQSLSPARRKFLPRQESNGSQRHYELVLDIKNITAFGDPSLSSTIAKLPTPQTMDKFPTYKQEQHQDSLNTDFGRSLLAGVCTAYSPYFVLSGIDKRIARMDEILLAIHEDVKHPTPMENACSPSTNGHLLSPSSSAILALSSCGGDSEHNTAHISGITNGFASPSAPRSAVIRPDSQHSPSRHGSNTPLLATKINPHTRAVVVVADCATRTVRIVSNSAEPCHVEDSEVSSPSEAVASMLEEFGELYKHGCAPTFLISFLEDRLSSVLAKSDVLCRLVSSHNNTTSTKSGLPLLTPTLASNTIVPSSTGPSTCSNAESAVGSLVEDMEMGSPPSHPQNGNLSSPSQYSSHDSTNIDAVTIQNGSGDDFLSMDYVAQVLDCHCSDLRLIVNVAAVYSPTVLSSVV